jgi:hypothetical protein
VVLVALPNLFFWCLKKTKKVISVQFHCFLSNYLFLKFFVFDHEKRLQPTTSVAYYLVLSHLLICIKMKCDAWPCAVGKLILFLYSNIHFYLTVLRVRFRRAPWANHPWWWLLSEPSPAEFTWCSSGPWTDVTFTHIPATDCLHDQALCQHW